MTRLEARGLTRRYGDVAALSDVGLRVEGGSVLCVMGPSGSGKSSLLRHLHLLERPDTGEVLLDGAPAPGDGQARLHALRRFALVQQTPGLLRTPAWRNVAFPLLARGIPEREAHPVALGQLDRLGLAHRAHALPASLSGGEAQRVALARALVTRPDLLLVDEGTNQLDPHAVRHVETLFKAEAARGCAVVLVTHNVPQARRLADRFLFLDQGAVVESGDRARLGAPTTDALRFFLETGA